MNYKSIQKQYSGFTLIEILIAMSIFTVITYAMIVLVSNILVSTGKQTGLIADSDQARKLAFTIVGELRNAEIASTGSYSLETAAPQTLTFYANIDGGSDIERLRYFVANNTMYKGVIKYNGSSYPSSSEKIVEVQRNLINSTSTFFSYYDGDYTGSSTQASLAQPVNVTSVKMVKISLPIVKKAGVVNNSSFTITASGAIRNLKTNLGD